MPPRKGLRPGSRGWRVSGRAQCPRWGEGRWRNCSESSCPKALSHAVTKRTVGLDASAPLARSLAESIRAAARAPAAFTPGLLAKPAQEMPRWIVLPGRKSAPLTQRIPLEVGSLASSPKAGWSCRDGGIGAGWSGQVSSDLSPAASSSGVGSCVGTRLAKSSRRARERDRSRDRTSCSSCSRSIWSPTALRTRNAFPSSPLLRPH